MGESKQGGYDKDIAQYQFNCPWCREENNGIPDGKYNLEINFEMGKHHCWKCEGKGTISKIIRRFGTKDQLQEYYLIVKDLKESKYYNIGLFDDNGVFVYDDSQYLRLPKTFKKIELKSLRKPKLLAYLTKRKITQDTIDFYNIGYTTWEEEEWQMRDRIIIPSYDMFGELNYWVGRDFTDNPKKVKYKNCSADKKKIVLHEDKIQWDADIVLVEGALDCIYYHNAIALLGKVLTRDSELYRAIHEKANSRITICLDSDTKIDETKRIYRLLNRGRLYGKINYVRMGNDETPYKDFGETYEEKGKKGIISLMNKTKTFDEIDLLI